LPFVATLCPVISRKTGFCLSFQVTFTVAVKAFQITPEFINVHLQQRDEVANVLRTMGF